MWRSCSVVEKSAVLHFSTPRFLVSSLEFCISLVFLYKDCCCRFRFFFLFFFGAGGEAFKNLSNFVVWTRSEEQLGISCDSSCKLCRFFDFVLTSLEFRSSNVFGNEIPIGFCVLRIFSSAACSSSFGEAQLSSAQQSLQRYI